MQRIKACEDKWDSWQVKCIQVGDLTEEWSRDMGKQQAQREQSELGSLEYGGTLAESEVIEFCW